MPTSSNLRRTCLAVAMLGVTFGVAQANASDAPPSASKLRTQSPGAAHLRCTIRGTNHHDVLRGTSGHDVICGLGGDDTIYAGGGDIVIAGPGNDTVYAKDSKRDLIDGGSGRDGIRFDRIDLFKAVEYRL
jgi:Ca2+-binding RTX toxin-like protein